MVSVSITSIFFSRTDKTPISKIRTPSSEAVLSTPTVAPSPSQPPIGFDLDFFNETKKPSTVTIATNESPIQRSDFEKNILLVLDTKETNLSNPKPYQSLNQTVPISNSQTFVSPVSETSDSCKALMNSVKELDLDSIDLIDDLTPIDLKLEDGCKDVSLSLTFGTSSGLSNRVKVAVITLTNRSASYPLSNYVFQLLPPKGIQVSIFCDNVSFV
jgi:hypothetical protein